MSSSDSEKKATVPTQEAFLSRWSRRKQAADETVLTTDTPADTPADTTEHTAAQELKQLCDADMPPLESLTEDSDYRGFLSPKVSEGLRRQALRKLFHSTGFNIRDGLDDYDEEFTHFEKLGDIVTADMRHQMEMEAQRRSERERELAEAEGEADAGAEVEMQEQEQEQEQIQTSDNDETQLTANEAETPITQAKDVENEA